MPVYNGVGMIERCLDALNASDLKAHEIIVVDDCSTDDSAAVARERGAKVLKTPKNMGPAGARNLAAEQAVGSVLLFVDADVVVEKSTLRKFAARFDEDPALAALFGSYDDAPAETNFLSQFKNLQHHYVHQTSNQEASTFWAGLGGVRRDVYTKVGGFDCRKFEVPSIEDIELGVRLRAAGYRILLDREITAKHLKKWKFVNLLKTEVFSRAIPWSKLIVTSQGLINDLNLKTNDRLSAVLVALSLLLVPLSVVQPWLLIAFVFCIAGIAVLNRRILGFFLRKKGVLFALGAYAWHYLYFFYSGAAFGYCWLRYGLAPSLGFGNKAETGST
ncbi:MAG: glycosyltransferase [Acidobacteria bacterium]|nr:MAG: glycosyltransferase [Acidobacteriota bacterium]REK03075.1 MAG: glycosyltransferase [Acidobacteriota bacterium]REK15423.1 MAG: glycosyltransferase [Acidobacteriota bacterium]REK45774.1 MAG: glycosyltransferase [Acidobacteriota bacterium]